MKHVQNHQKKYRKLSKFKTSVRLKSDINFTAAVVFRISRYNLMYGLTQRLKLE